jgi:MEMO1 family protein
MDPLVTLARLAIEAIVRRRERIEPPPDPERSAEMRERAGVFVSLHDAGGELRGCIGTFEPQEDNVAEEIISNAISAATRDPRFYPVQARELESLDVSVDLLSSPERIKGVEELDPKRYGVIVTCGRRRGLLLPDLEGVDSVEQQIDICRRKGGIGPREPVELQRFLVRRFH